MPRGTPKNFATLEIPLTTMQIDYKLNYDDPNCKDLCSWAQSQLAAPKFNLKLGPFYLSGNGVYDASNECNWVNNGKGDWNIEFDNTGEDLKGALANPACPY